MAKDENQPGTDVTDEIRSLCERIDKVTPNSMWWRVVSHLQSLKALEKQEFEYRSRSDSDCSDNNSSHSLEECNRRLESAKQDLAEKLRSVVSLKRQLDDVASPAELIQYEHRFTQLNTQIQKKLQQTRKHYDTYNALLEIKEIMLKEISLLNSISLQFQSAITSADGRTKLINSLEGILNGTQQKLDKVEVAWESEQKFYDRIREKYTTAVSEQRQSSSLFNVFQEECARNEKLRAQINERRPST